MSGPGRKAALPDTDWRRPQMVDASGLVANAVSQDGKESASFDFGDLPGPVEFRRELVAAFAGNIRTRWHSPESWRKHAAVVREFLEFAAERQPPVTAVDEITAKVWEDWKTTEWRRSLRTTLRATATLTGSARAAMDVVHRGYQPQPLATYSAADIKELRRAAAATVRAACLRIEGNVALMERWRAGSLAPGSAEEEMGRLLDQLARTGDVPRYPGGRTHVRVASVLFGSDGTFAAWAQLFPTMAEMGAAGLLMICVEGWNLSVLQTMRLPQQWPNADATDDEPVIHRLDTDKPRRGRDRYASNNLVDVGPGSAGAAMRQVIAMSRQARSTLENLGAATDSLFLARRKAQGSKSPLFAHAASMPQAIAAWRRRFGTAAGLSQVTARILRHSTQVLHGAPRNNSAAVQDRDYLLRSATVREQSRAVVEAGLQAAVAQARAQLAMRMVPATGDADLTADVRADLAAGRLKTPVANCGDFQHSPLSAGGPCAVSFLMCFACTNALATGRDLPGIVYLHQGLDAIRSAVTGPVWAADWAGHFARVSDFLAAHTNESDWPALRSALSPENRTLIDQMLERRLES